MTGQFNVRKEPQHWEMLFIKLAPLVEEVRELQIPAGTCKRAHCILPKPLLLAPRQR